MPNVGPYIYTTLAFLALLGAPYIYEISSLRANIIKWQVKFNSLRVKGRINTVVNCHSQNNVIILG